jgi:hypothetical protein
VRNRVVHLSKLIQTPKGPRYCFAVLAANGRVRPHVVIVNGQEERHAEGSYYISWYEGRKLVRRSVGKDAQARCSRKGRKQATSSSPGGRTFSSPIQERDETSERCGPVEIPGS